MLTHIAVLTPSVFFSFFFHVVFHFSLSLSLDVALRYISTVLFADLLEEARNQEVEE